jgi:hypothetical protein
LALTTAAPLTPFTQSKKMILEDKLYANLKKLDSRITWTSEKKRGVPQTPNVPGLGNVGELLTLFEKQCYIRKDRSASKTLDGDDIFEFSLGARFHLEIGGKQVGKSRLPALTGILFANRILVFPLSDDLLHCPIHGTRP